jgi:DNA-binding HxlR family transcriptional regulator
VRGTLFARLLRLVRRHARDGEDGARARAGDRSAKRENQRNTLDWKAAQERLGPVRHRWDLAILCNLDDGAGRRPADLLAAVNSQAGAGRQLSPQVLSGRLRELQQGGYVRHEDFSLTPLNRVYYLLPPGRALIADLSLILRTELPARPPGQRSRGALGAGQ